MTNNNPQLDRLIDFITKEISIHQDGVHTRQTYLREHVGNDDIEELEYEEAEKAREVETELYGYIQCRDILNVVLQEARAIAEGF